MIFLKSSKKFQLLLLFLIFQVNYHLSQSESTITISEAKIMNNKTKLSSEQLAKLEMEQFQLEMDDFKLEQRQQQENENQYYTSSSSNGRRVKRTVIFNSAAPIDVVVLFGIPITVILPVLSNVFTNLNWSKIFKWKRSVNEEEDQEEEVEEFSDESILVQPHLDKITGYFELMRIPEKSCQQRAICEFSANPSKYYPVSELILNRIRNPSLPPLSYIYDVNDYYNNFNNNNNDLLFHHTINNATTSTTTSNIIINQNVAATDNNNSSGRNSSQTQQPSLFRLYAKAADRGLAYGQNICNNDFATNCPYSIEKRLNMPVLQFWNLLSSLLKFNIHDNIDTSSF